MIDERAATLISAVLDDALDPSERNELNERLAQSSDARHYYDQMTKLDARLKSVPEIPEPYELHGQIMRGLPTASGRSDSFFLAPFWSGVMRYGLAAVAGVLFAVGVYESKPDDVSKMAGTIAPQATVLDGFQFAVEGLSSAVDLERRGQKLALDIVVDTENRMDLVIRFPSDSYRLGMLEQNENEFEFCEFADGVIRAGVQGNHEFVIALAPRDGSALGKDAAITLEYSGDGRMVQKTLVPGR